MVFMPAAMWSLMWQWKNQFPALSHSMSAVCTLPASRLILHRRAHSVRSLQQAIEPQMHLSTLEDPPK